ncbi:MAG TPA: glycosyltransferase family 9 protein [Steroidobacteraceae bacterium]|jgi:heptosyltransferase-2/heptosyltransferase-3|nr:glycosyltransferase family 9 protein [Steroidobacteraceae bacterium]
MNPRPLVVRFGALGDMVLLTTLIRHLHQRFNQPVDIVSSGPWTRPLLEGQPGVGEIFVIRSRNLPYWLNPEQQQLVAALRKRGAGPTWLCDYFHREKTQSLLRRAGWTPQHWCEQFNLPDLHSKHFCDLWLRFAYRNPPIIGGEDLPCNATDAWPSLQLTEQQRQQGMQWLASHQLDNKPLILIQAGNKRTMRRFGFRQRNSNSKYWPEQNWGSVLRELHVMHPDHAIVMLGVPSESPLNQDIMAQASISNVHDLAPEMTIPRLMMLCERAYGMVTVDTGPAHVASALGCKMVTLFGKAAPEMYAPRGANAIVRCLTGTYENETSMLGITPAMVMSAWQDVQARRS